MVLGISAFRVQSDGSPLPNARNLTLTIFQDTLRICDYKNNELLVPWGQFITHDTAFSPVRSVNSSFPGNILLKFERNNQNHFQFYNHIVCILLYSCSRPLSRRTSTNRVQGSHSIISRWSSVRKIQFNDFKIYASHNFASL